jgi:CRP-like cAMP-binding protein
VSASGGREWPLFASVPAEELRTVLEVARRRTFDRGEVVFHRGDPADTLHHDFARLQRRHPGVNAVLVALLAEKVRRASERIVEAHYADAETRVRRRLLDLLPLYAAGEGDCEVPLTQEDLAELAGTSRATVNRVLRDEQRRGAVELRRGRTLVRDREELARRARLPL